jgi:hypothetical protein
MIAHLKNAGDVTPISSILATVYSRPNNFSGDSPIVPFEFRNINDSRTIGSQKRTKIFDVKITVDAAAILNYSTAQGAMHEKNLGNGNFTSIEKVVNVMGEKPIPCIIPPGFLHGSIKSGIAGQRPYSRIPVFGNPGWQARRNNPKCPG